MQITDTRRSRALSALIALLAWAGLSLQLYLWLTSPASAGRSLASLLAQFFGYFTIQTNLMVAVLTTRECGRTQPHWLAVSETAAAVYIAVVGIGYSLLLRHLQTLQGLDKLADTLLHDVVPVLYVAWWIFFARKVEVAWSSITRFLVWPLLYLAGTLVCGAITGVYLYPFVDAGKLGYPRMLTMSAVLLLVFVLLSAIAIALTRRKTSTSD